MVGAALSAPATQVTTNPPRAMAGYLRLEGKAAPRAKPLISLPARGVISTRKATDAQARLLPSVYASTRASDAVAPSGEVWNVSSTSYCQAGTMADGNQTYVGAVAGNMWPLGTKLVILGGEHQGEVVTVEDRIGAHSQLDFFTPSCAAAWIYGREQIEVREVN